MPQNKDLLKKLKRQEDRIKWLKDTWLKLKKFKMSSTGIAKLDIEIKQLFGDWNSVNSN